MIEKTIEIEIRSEIEKQLRCFETLIEFNTENDQCRVKLMYSGISVDWNIVWVKTEDIEKKFEHFKIFAVDWKTCWWKNSGDNNSLRLKTVELLNVKQWRFYDTTDWAQPPSMNINVLLWTKYYNKKTTPASTKNTSWLFRLEVHYLKLVWFID